MLGNKMVSTPNIHKELGEKGSARWRYQRYKVPPSRLEFITHWKHDKLEMMETRH